MNVYLLTNLLSGARALVLARAEYEARHRRPDGALWRLGRWYRSCGQRIAPPLEWWPGSPDDILVDPIMNGIDDDSDVLQNSAVIATKSPRRPIPLRRATWARRPERDSDCPLLRPSRVPTTIVAAAPSSSPDSAV